MLRTTSFTFGPFQENTWVLDNGPDAILIDPGCSNSAEERALGTWLSDNALKPVRLVLTHAHIDHVLGVAWACERYGLVPELHADAVEMLRTAPRQGMLYGIPCEPAPEEVKLLAAGDTVALEGGSMEVLHVPGHAPGHIALYCADQAFVIAGDVMFRESIGRTDLPGGDTGTLLESIRTQLLPLGDTVEVHCGHGPSTTIGHERSRNPFLRQLTGASPSRSS